MRRDWKPASKTVEHPVLTLWPSTLQDHDLVERVLKALDLRDDPNACIACGGSSLSSKGYACIPCHGTGTQGIHEIIGATIVYEMKSLCICGSRHFEYIGSGREQNCYACHKCGKKYRSVKGIFESLPMSNVEMAAALAAKRAASVPLQEVKEDTGRKAPPASPAAAKPKTAVRVPTVAPKRPAASQGPSASKPLKVRVNVKPRKT